MSKIDISECEVEIDTSSEHTIEDKLVEGFIQYVHENSDYKIEKKY